MRRGASAFIAPTGLVAIGLVAIGRGEDEPTVFGDEPDADASEEG